MELSTAIRKTRKIFGTGSFSSGMSGSCMARTLHAADNTCLGLLIAPLGTLQRRSPVGIRLGSSWFMYLAIVLCFCTTYSLGATGQTSVSLCQPSDSSTNTLSLSPVSNVPTDWCSSSQRNMRPSIIAIWFLSYTSVNRVYMACPTSLKT